MWKNKKNTIIFQLFNISTFQYLILLNNMKRLRAKLIKRILGILLIMWCSGIFLNGYVGVGEQVHAQTQITTTNPTSSSLSTMNLWQILNMILKIIYLLLWPLLVVAGLALDNTLVYASLFHLDAPLWKFWNMIKNFANFTLWFMVLFAIIKNLFTTKDDKWPMEIIKKTLIAGILIQASRFLMAALIDVSTIATYAVGGLPLSVLKNTDMGQQKILTVNSVLDLSKFSVISSAGNDFKVSYSTTYKDWNTVKKIDLSPCKVVKWYVVGREFTEAQYRNSDIFWIGQSACVALSNQVVIYNEFPHLKNVNGIQYQGDLDRVLNAQPDRWPREACNYVIKISWPTPNLWACWAGFADINSNYANSSNATEMQISFMDLVTSTTPTNIVSSTLWMQWWKTWFESGNVLAMTVSDLINKSKWFVGPLVTMYSSLLNFAQLTDTNISTTSETSGIFLIKTLVAIALFFPLLALAVVLIARVGMLWLYIAASPFLVIKKVFGDVIPKMGDFDKHLDIMNVVKLIFAPVITVAALSISLIFMTALVNWFKSDTTNIAPAVLESFQVQSIAPITPGNSAMQMGPTSLEFKNFDRGWSLDRFSRLIVNFFAIGLLRTIVFAAIKANSLGEKIGGEIQKFGTNVFSTLPVLPIGQGGAWVGIGGAANVISNIPNTWVDNRQQSDREVVTNRLEWPSKAAWGTWTALSATNVDNIMKNTTITPDQIKASIATEKWITVANVTPAMITGNEKVFYDKLSKLPDNTDKESRKTAIGEASGNKSWFENIAKAEATTKFESLVKIQKTSTVDDLSKKVNDVANKDTMEALLAANPTWYEKTIDNTKFTITKNTDSNAQNRYVVKSETITPKANP